MIPEIDVPTSNGRDKTQYWPEMCWFYAYCSCNPTFVGLKIVYSINLMNPRFRFAAQIFTIWHSIEHETTNRLVLALSANQQLRIAKATLNNSTRLVTADPEM